MGPLITLADMDAELALWNAALALLIEDARDYLQRGPDKSGHREAAHADLLAGGPMTRRLARFCALDPDEVRRQFRAWCAMENQR